MPPITFSGCGWHPNSHFVKSKTIGSLIGLWLALSVHSATFTLTPTVVSNEYPGLLLFQMSGLPSGDTVLVQQFWDANSNGVVDPGELCVRSELVTDGQARLFNGATNINLFRDEDGSTNGRIAASIRFAAAPDLARGIANYLFRFSSPANHFAATNIAFTVGGTPGNQTVQGTVMSGALSVPYAYVALVQNSLGGVQIVVAGTTTGPDGHYALKAPPGLYQVLAVQSGFVGNLTSFPVVALSTNATVTTNLYLQVADSRITGSVVDSVNPALGVIPNAQLIAYSTNLLFTVAAADSNANFSFPVTANNVWTVRVTAQSAATEGYLVPDASIESHYETFSGPVSNALVQLKHATALLEGQVQDKLGNPISGIGLFANADFGQYNTFGVSDGTGRYSLAIDGGEGTVNVQNAGSPPAANFIWPTPQFAINDGQAESLTVTGLMVTARFRAHVVTDTGLPLSDLQCVADSYQYYGAYSFASTDANGFLDLPVFGGEWNFGWFSDLPTNLIFPDVPPFTITDGVNLTNDMVARTVTGTVSGYVHDGYGQPVTNLPVTITNQVGATSFTLYGNTDASGNYAVAVFDGTWTVSLDNNALDLRGYATPVAAVPVTVPPASGIANFIVSTIPPPQVLTTSLPDGLIGSYYSVPLEETNGSDPTLWSLVSGTLPDGLVLSIFGYIYGSPTNVGLFSFSLKVQDPRGSNNIVLLSIRVALPPTGPPALLSTYLTVGALGCPYLSQLVATKGTAPYTWSLAAGSDPLPTGLQLTTNGVIVGTPLTNGYFSLELAVTGADGEFTNGSVQLQLNDPLQYFPYPLAAGSVGASYFGALSAYGGAQPQTWSLLTGALPVGLVLDPATGYISGMPTAVGVSPFTLRVTDGCTTIDVPTAITNYPALQITTTTLPTAPLNTPFSAQLQAAGGVPPYSWYGYPALPVGLTLNLDGSITGTAYVAGATVFTAEVSDAIGDSVTTNLTLIVSSQAILDMAMMAGPNQFIFRVTGIAGQDYTVQSSLDLSNWTDLFITNAPASSFYLGDSNAADPTRFYRLMESP